MKLNAGKRILMFFHWLLSLLICAALAVYVVKPEWIMQLYNQVTAGMTPRTILIIGIAILAVYVILAVLQATIIFRRGKRTDRGFIIVDSSDNGRVRIAVAAIEQMVRQSVHTIDGISDMRIAIENLDDAIGIDVVATINNGCHVPTITMNMQRAIRQFVEMNCGVAVRTVSVSINGVSSNAEVGKRRKGRKGDQAAAVTSFPSYTPEPVKSEPTPAPVEREPEPVQPQVSRFEPEPEPVQPQVSRFEPEPEPVEPQVSAYEPEPEPEEVVEMPRMRDPSEPIKLTLDPPTPVGEAPADHSAWDADVDEVEDAESYRFNDEE